MNWHDKFGRLFWLIITILFLILIGVVVLVQVPNALPAYLLGIPSGVLAGKWLCSKLTVFRLVIIVATSLFLIGYVAYSSKFDKFLPLASYLAVLTYIAFSSATSADWLVLRRNANSNAKVNRGVLITIIAVGSIAVISSLVDFVHGLINQDKYLSESWIFGTLNVITLLILLRQSKEGSKKFESEATQEREARG